VGNSTRTIINLMTSNSIDCIVCKLSIEQPDDIFKLELHRISPNSDISHNCIRLFPVYSFHLTCLPDILKAPSGIPVTCNCDNNISAYTPTTVKKSDPPAPRKDKKLYPIIHGGKNTYRSNPTLTLCHQKNQ
jgi:hypothetical protein